MGIQQSSRIKKKNAQKLTAILYSSNEAAEKETKESIPFPIAPNPDKIPRKNLTKEVKDLYYENYRTLMNEIKEETKTWKNVLCSQTGKTNTVKMYMLPREIHPFSANPIKMPPAFLTE